MSRAKCELCGKPVPASAIAAAVYAPSGSKKWCFDCWDNREEAVEQYREAQMMAQDDLRTALERWESEG